jgi:hypothetical protein
VPAGEQPADDPPPPVLPTGWHMYEDSTGFRVPVPKSWRVYRKGTEVYFEERGGEYRQLIVDQTRTPQWDPVADWTGKERHRRSGYRSYERIRIESVDFWKRAADWEYRRNSSNNNRVHTLKRGFITADDQAYGITWVTPENRWAANRDELDLIFKGFVPARAD